MQKMEDTFNFTDRLAYLEELKSYPFNAVWDYYCEKNGVPQREQWLNDVHTYEKDVLGTR